MNWAVYHTSCAMFIVHLAKKHNLALTNNTSISHLNLSNIIETFEQSNIIEHLFLDFFFVFV